MTDYITWLRSHIGSRKTLLAYSTALIRDDQGRVLFQQRADFKDAWWGLPGGVLELGESFTACVQRETLEETGYHVEPVRLIGLYASPEFDVCYPNGDEVQQFTVALECGIVDGRRTLTMSIHWYMETTHLGEEHPPLWRIHVEGQPGVKITVEMEKRAGDTTPTSAEQIAVAGTVINAIPLLCAAPPGVMTRPFATPFRAELAKAEY